MEEKIKEEIADPEVKILDIGIAGEKGVSYAAVFSSSVRAAAMTGVGSIMGAKNLKAIAVRGTRGVRLADPQGFQEAALECHQKVRSGPVYKEFSQLGTLGFLQDAFEAYGYLIVRNFQQTWLPQDVFEPISGATWMKRYKVKDLACFGCPVHCSHYFRVKEGPYTGLKGEGLEYYAHTIFTNNLGVFDPSFAIKCTKLADELGLDIGNTGHTLAYAAELYQRGIITQKDADNLELSWGN